MMIDYGKLEKEYGAFRVFASNDMLVQSGSMTESQATELAIAYDGRIEHQDPDTKIWYRW